MQIRIPFTDVKITIAESSSGEQRGKRTGRSSYDIARDEMGTRISRDDLFNAYRSSADVYSCVREIKETVGIGGFRFVNENNEDVSDQVTSQIEEFIGYTYNDLIDFKDHVFDQSLVSGDMYAEKIKAVMGDKILGVQVLDARSMAIVADQHGRINRYIQHSPYNANWSDVTIFDASEIINMKISRDPNNEMFGLSPLEPVLWDVKADLSASIANYHLFENHAMPAGMIIMDENASDESLSETVKLLRKQYKGARNKGKLMASKNIKDIKVIGQTHVEMEYLQGRRFSTEKVCSAFGVPKAILGYTEGMTFNNQDGQMRKFYNNTVRKYERMFEAMFNREILEKCLGLSGVYLKFMEPMFENEDALYQRARESRIAGIITTNEARDIIGKDPIEDSVHAGHGDVIVSGVGTNMRLLVDAGVDADSQDALDSLQKAVKEVDEYVS